MARYAMVDANGDVVNVVVWNGDETTWKPPAGVTMVLAEEESEPGGKFDAQSRKFTMRPKVAQLKTVEQRLAELEQVLETSKVTPISSV